jgi:hypothetical protein
MLWGATLRVAATSYNAHATRKNLVAAIFLLGSLMPGCDGDGTAKERGPMLALGDAGSTPPAVSPRAMGSDPVSARCLLVATDEPQREDTFMDIASEYFYAMSEDCRTQRLMSTMTLDQMVNWFDYIYNYTSALFGCGLQFTPLPGGVEAFGPGNVDAVGVVTAPLIGVDDMNALIEIYLGVCTTYVDIPASELDAIRAELEAAASSQIDATLGASLSECVPSAPTP